MKSTLIRLSALLLTFSVGIAIPQLFKCHLPIESIPTVPLSAVASPVSHRCYGPDYILKGGHIVVAVPNDGEFYFGKRRIALSEIRELARKASRNDTQIVFIKSAAHVRFETLSLVADEIRAGGVTCIDFRLDKKKKGI